MNETLTLPTGQLEHPGMDYELLRQAGIDHLQQMAKAGLPWTDFNTHDPGITILEQLCYAITDLGYRIAYQIPDLLASGGSDPHESIYSPARIMTIHPVTLNDLRKLVLDVSGVKNVWIEKIKAPRIPLHYHEGRQELSLQAEFLDSEPVQLKGLYRVLIETSDLADIDGTLVQQKAAERLHANRPLCEDFEEIRILGKQDIRVDARVEIGSVDDAEEVLLEIYEKISNYFSPRIPFATVEEMRKAGTPVDRIFDGPHLKHGFVDSETLQRAQRRTTIHTSDLIHEIMGVDGVRAVRDIRVAIGDQSEAWSLKVPADSTPVLDLDQSKITLEKDRLVAGLDAAKVRKKYFDRLAQSAALYELNRAERDLITPQGRDRNVGKYYSVQHHFPACYGIGEMGLPASATVQRQDQSKQLKAYLMFFDQLLANYFAQLAHVKDLFSFNSSTADTYFTQAAANPGLGLNKICKREPEDHADRVREIMDGIVGPATSLERKNRFLNHLLARFAEQFTDYSLFLFEVMPQGIPPAEKMIHDKQAFLKQYPAVSSARGMGFNYMQPLTRENVSGLEKRIRLKMGLIEEQGEIFYLVEHILLRPMQEDLQQQIAFLTHAHARDPYSLQLSFIFPKDWDARLPTPDFEGMAEQEKKMAEERFAEKKASFRRFIEQTVREETPAHLTPYIHWLSRDAMTEFESAYKAWAEKRRSYWAT